MIPHNRSGYRIFSILVFEYEPNPFLLMLDEINMPEAIKKRGILNPKRNTLIYSKNGNRSRSIPEFLSDS
jgi:hypothetical protein